MSTNVRLLIPKNGEARAGLTEEELREMSESVVLVNLPRGRFLDPHGGDRASIYQLKWGRVKLSHLSPEGKELILGFIEPGQIFGEMNLLDEAPHEIIGMAVEHSRIFVIPRASFERFLQRKPELALKVARLIALRRKRAESRLGALVFKKVPARLADLLLDLCKEYGVPDHRGTLLRIRLSQQDMGNLIGASREIVNVTLSSFRRQGLIEVDGRRLIIREQRLSNAPDGHRASLSQRA